MALGEIDLMEYILAEKLGKSLSEVRSMPNFDFVEWQAFYNYRHAMEDFEMKKAEARRGKHN